MEEHTKAGGATHHVKRRPLRRYTLRTGRIPGVEAIRYYLLKNFLPPAITRPFAPRVVFWPSML